MKKKLTIIFILTLGACSTVAGVGKDVTDAAEWSKKEISKKMKTK